MPGSRAATINRLRPRCAAREGAENRHRQLDADKLADDTDHIAFDGKIQREREEFHKYFIQNSPFWCLCNETKKP